MRKKIIAANWKMNKTYGEALMLATEVADDVSRHHHTNFITILAPAFPFLTAVSRAVDGTDGIEVAAQNCSQHASGAFTGEVSVPMIISCGAHYVIIGHSERRQLFGETNEAILAKLRIALGSGLKTILCIGETEAERNAGKQNAVIGQQLSETLFHLDESLARHCVIAYEPVWAIGTGKNATPEEIQEIHSFVRKKIGEKFGIPAAAEISILYGGSCTPANADSIFICPDVDGGLIGGASLSATDFAAIRRAMLKRM
ncbi:MAG TPA: triose-phosphate isomerase [Bacteroidia bacterium]|jgi:triosephosphate isomerase|nr:triose-phosphate isomerase [Bacteroidia bacterium]